ncbi:MAG: RNA methyltransferase [Prevotellaceae bacterium]|nr:RNA methyltransferase [Prevotellaceae bacterium]
METINSVQNYRVKAVVELAEKSRERRSSGLFVLEGAREMEVAVKCGYSLQTLFVCRSRWGSLRPLPAAEQCFEVSAAVFAKLAYREGSDGLLAVAEQKELRLDSLQLSATPFIIVLEAVEKPGNLGAILRTADAAKADAVIVCDPQCDVYNPNVVRSSIGCLFSTQLACCSSDEALSYLRQHGITTMAAELQGSTSYHEADMRQPCAVVVGAEADGLTNFWLSNADLRIKIPMRGAIDSLNVSVSTAVITFEAMRQRNFL